MTAPHPVNALMDRRRRLALVTALGGLSSLVFGVMLFAGLNEHGRPWVGGPEFVTDVTLSSAMAVLGVTAGVATARQGRRMHGFPATTWLSDEKGVPLEPQTLKLRTLSRNAGFFAAFWVVVFLLAVSSLTTGLGVFNGFQAGLHLVAVLVAAFAIPMSSAASRNWARRYRAVRRTGWHATKSIIIRRPEGRPAEEALITVRFGDGSTIDLRSAGSTYRAGHKEGQRLLEAWMVVMFEYGKWRQGMYPVPVIALESRTVSSAEESLPT
ncbi:hypothetical protein [Amycolatopsis pittospori]|uniref:hypothetical protein n=1 Tax=Amycolatopsis pittospori TaxID=2749434 RepID=UPI0015F101C3|nr:hypothetical protein [Amycolatopsis pittospori]